MYLSMCSGLAPCFKVICRGQSSARVRKLHIFGVTNAEHCRHLEILGCGEGSEDSWSGDIRYERYGVRLMNDLMACV